MSIGKYLDLSTAHVQRGTINPPHKDYLLGDYVYGAIYYVPDEIDPGTPGDLKAVLAFAKAQGCYLVRLDADGEVYEELPVYDW